MLYINIDVKYFLIDGYYLKFFMYLSNIIYLNLFIWNKWYLLRKDGKYSIVKVRVMRIFNFCCFIVDLFFVNWFSNYFVIIKIMYICCEDKIIYFYCIFIV